jgi:hypothetical protein
MCLGLIRDVVRLAFIFTAGVFWLGPAVSFEITAVYQLLPRLVRVRVLVTS